MTYSLGNTSRQRLEGVDERVIPLLELALTLTKVDFGVPADGGLRTAERQHELYAMNRSKADGYKTLSAHQSGKAFDVFAYASGRASWDEELMTHIATAILAAASQLGVPLQWGGHWRSFVDMPHFEILEGQ